MRTRLSTFVCLLFLLAGSCAFASETRRCVLLPRESPPKLMDARGAAERDAHRSALVQSLRRESAEAAAPVATRLRAAGARDLRLHWGAGVLCASADATAWDALARARFEVFEDRALPDAMLDDDGVPNGNVPPENPLVALRVPELWARGLTGDGVVVALIDTGIDAEHPDLAHALWVNEDEVPDNGIDDDGNGFVDDVHGWNFSISSPDIADSTGHGTRSAGLLAGNGASGRQTGAAPGARLMIVRRGGTQELFWAASDYAIANGARVISQSSSWKHVVKPEYSAWRRQLETELAAGVLRINSGGNTGTQTGDNPVPYNLAAPANCPPPWHHPDQNPKAGVSSVLAIGNVDAESHAIAATSPYGPSEWTDIQAHHDPAYPHTIDPAHRDYPVWDGSPGLGKPDLVAPGDGSLSTKRGGGYENYDGTSAATPRVAGIAALLLHAAPDATPAALAEALLTNARDLGPAGRDLRYGAGLVDALAAYEALGPALRLSAHVLHDEAPPRGDGDGGVDEGEIARLELTVENLAGVPADDVELLVRGVAQVEVRDPYAWLGTVSASGIAGTSAPHLAVSFPAGSCAKDAELEVEIRSAGGRRVERLVVAIGTETRTPLIDTGFESGAGFSVEGDASAGAWVRAVPVGTLDGGLPANPSADHGAPPDSHAYVTGNGPSSPDAADVDAGETRLSSPPVDASGFARVELSYHRWFFGDDPAGGDRYRVEASPDGTSWTTLEELAAADNAWRRRDVPLSAWLTPGASTTLRFAVSDAGADHTVEGGLDDVALVGIDLACTPYAMPGTAPDAVGASLRLAPAPGGHLALRWDAPSASGGVDPEQGYRVLRSTRVDGGHTERARPVDTRHVELDGMSAAEPLVTFLVESITP